MMMSMYSRLRRYVSALVPGCCCHSLNCLHVTLVTEGSALMPLVVFSPGSYGSPDSVFFKLVFPERMRE